MRYAVWVCYMPVEIGNLLLKLHYAYLTQGLYYHGFTYQKSAYVGFIFHTIAPISAISHFKG